MIKLATVFSGIGSIEQAFINLEIEHEIVFACDNGERELGITFQEITEKTQKMTEIDKTRYINEKYGELKKVNYVEQSYKANYPIDEKKWHQDIRFINGKKYRNCVDILVGGSPCQSFSVIGKRRGLEDARGTLFYEYARLIKEIQPKVFIYENVVGLLSHDKGNTWELIKIIFDKLGYSWKMQIMNSSDYGVPQNRRRVFVVGTKKKKSFEFPEKRKLTKCLNEYLETNVEEKYYLGKKGFEFVTNPKYRNRAQVNGQIAMCQKANQQYNWNGDFIFEELNERLHKKIVSNRVYLGLLNDKKGYIRKLTPHECVNLMGFPRNFIITVPDVQAYRQSGNSIVVGVFEAILQKLIEGGYLD